MLFVFYCKYPCEYCDQTKQGRRDNVFKSQVNTFSKSKRDELNECQPFQYFYHLWKKP